MKPTFSAKQQRLDECVVKAPPPATSKRRKATQQQQQLRESDSATDEHSYIIENTPTVSADSTCRANSAASLKRSRNSITTATKSQKQTVEGIAFPPTFQENSNSMTSTNATTAETARLQAEIEELKRSVQTLLASNKNLRDEQAVKTQKIVDSSDDSRAHRFATTATRRELPRREMSREIPIDVPNPNAVQQEEPPRMVHKSTSIPTNATKSVGLSATSTLSDDKEESSGEESSVCSRRPSRKQRRAKYMR